MSIAYHEKVFVKVKQNLPNEEEYTVAFKERLKGKRKEAGLSQAELAARVGVTSRTIQNYELGNRKPQNMEIVQNLAEALNTTADYLLGNADRQILAAYARGGAKAARDVEALIGEISGLFAGGELDEDEKDAVMAALTRAYWDAKEENKKYASGGKRSQSS
jgi:transcriptional regulator with XRE-family HTH domain